VSIKITIKLTANFERNLHNIEAFLAGAEQASAFDTLLDELIDTVIPNLERFPGMGRPFFARPILSVEATLGIEQLKNQLSSLSSEGELREYVMKHYLVLYAHIDSMVYLLCIRHHRQEAFQTGAR
jgi:plasmid stabilization system protein ParE